MKKCGKKKRDNICICIFFKGLRVVRKYTLSKPTPYNFFSLGVNVNKTPCDKTQSRFQKTQIYAKTKCDYHFVYMSNTFYFHDCTRIYDDLTQL